MAGQPQGTGFSQHVWGQLNDYANQSSQQHRGRGRGYARGSRSRGGQQTLMTPPYHQTDTSFQSPPPSMDSFPPLGSLYPPNPSQSFARPQSRGNGHASRPQPRGSFTHAAAPRSPYQQNQNFQVTSPTRQQFRHSWEEPGRPADSSGRLYHPSHAPQSLAGMYSNFDPTERAFRQQVMQQSDYLNQVHNEARQKYQLKKEEQLRKEGFRKTLESMFQNVLARQYPTMNADEVRLRCYGSLNNGFGLANCDMDLLLALPDELDFINKDAEAAQTEGSSASAKPTQEQDAAGHLQDSDALGLSHDARFEVALLLEGALLDIGIGARLLTKTRVPILRVCEKPDDELLENLRIYRRETADAVEAASATASKDDARTPPDMNMTEIASALSELASEGAAAQISLPGSPPKSKQPALEFVGDCGIQCDINFTNFVAVHNTKLLREYCEYDSRVGEVGTFVKSWAKIRDINTPYLGTLSSYGYVLMVLHYLMNVVQPPVIPNLQQLAYNEGSWATHPPAKFEDKFDVRFWQDSDKLAEFKASQPRNRESTGHLLRGFFWYYSAREGFNFKNDIVSIRSRGGLLRKANKGWTEAKWSDQKKNVRQRYLLAIEDPFETDHNVARVVGHNGIVAIRDEFRRAWSIITAVGGPNPPTEGLLEPAEARGDLLRRDQDHHREKMKKMRQEMEARQKQALQETLIPAESTDAMAGAQHARESQDQIALQANGMLKQEASCSKAPSQPAKFSSRGRLPKYTQLTEDIGVIQEHSRQHRHGRIRRVRAESDEESDGTERPEVAHQPPGNVSSSQDQISQFLPRSEAEELKPFCSPSEFCRSQGYDLDGKPIAWDIRVQDGRWLRWRDNKIRQGKWRGSKNPSHTALDERYPYDPNRPAPEGDEDLKLANKLFYVSRPPYPLNKMPEINSTETAIVANVVKHLHRNRAASAHRQRKGRGTSARKATVPELDVDTSFTATAEPAVSDPKLSHPVQNGAADQPKHLSRVRICQATASNNDWELPTTHNPDVEPWLRAEVQDLWKPQSPGRRPVLLCAPDDLDTLAEFPGHYDRHSLASQNSLLRGSRQSSSKVIERVSSLIQPINYEPTTSDAPLEEDSVTMPDTAFIRSRRLAYYAQKEKRADPTQSDSNETHIAHDESPLMEESRIGSQDATQHRPRSLSLRSHQCVRRSPFHNLQLSGNHLTSSPPGTAFASSIDSGASDLSRPMAAVQHNLHSQKQEMPQVPLSLCPELAPENRPRDEDPRIMPIPQEIGFKFDVRQLRDLAVIKEGGNGCAVEGYEFEIQEEDDDEWIGSGVVNWTSTKKTGASASWPGPEPSQYEYGKGDEEGLLGELPGPEM